MFKGNKSKSCRREEKGDLVSATRGDILSLLGQNAGLLSATMLAEMALTCANTASTILGLFAGSLVYGGELFWNSCSNGVPQLMNTQFVHTKLLLPHKSSSPSGLVPRHSAWE